MVHAVQEIMSHLMFCFVTRNAWFDQAACQYTSRAGVEYRCLYPQARMMAHAVHEVMSHLDVCSFEDRLVMVSSGCLARLLFLLHL